ncbi:BNR/Asp-box repeat protein [Mycena sanguinolenta]|uniref:BNR/Asp-box repeat protein n=1 Tax=Mycena sanguinolenta TaxID=230812 RepID=A0A8H7CS34_9AGAR|nr:BNR/Asp-box repeat protein [Mycena sanguinolenta]
MVSPRIAVSLLLLWAVSVCALTVVPPYSRRTIFSPPSTYLIPRTLYARTLLIPQDGADENVLLATWENYSPEPPNVWFPIFRSLDLGQTWAPFSNVTDTQNGWGLRYQPFLYEMTETIGTFPAGTVLCAGNSIPTNLSNTQIDLYASLDKGRTWNFVSHIAAGGEAIPDNGLTPVWEPFIITFNHQIVLYYSDQRDPLHGQKLAHQASSDLLTWGPIVNDVALPTFSDRPGMTTITNLPNGQFIMTYEYGGAPEADFAIYFRVSDSPLTFNSVNGSVIRAVTGELPTSSPYVTWTAHGGANGTIIVSANSHTGVFVNTALAAPGTPWTYVDTNATASYTRQVRVLPSNNQIILAGGGTLGGTANSVTGTILEL